MNDKIISMTKENDKPTIFDKNSGKPMNEVTYCVILGCLAQAEDELKSILYDNDSDERPMLAKNMINDAQEALFSWYEYGKEVSLED